MSMFWSQTGPCIIHNNDVDAETTIAWTRSKAEAVAQLYKKMEFTNLILVSEDGIEFPVHSEIVCATSDYFDCIIRYDAHDSVDNIPKMSIHGITGFILKVVLDFLYTGVLDITLETVSDLYRAGDFFTLPGITGACIDWFIASFEDKQVCQESGLLLFELCQQYEYPQLTMAIESLLFRSPFYGTDIFRHFGCDFFMNFFKKHYLRDNDRIIMGRNYSKRISELFKLCFPDKTLDSPNGLLDRPANLYITELGYALHPIPGPGFMRSDNWYYTCEQFPPQDWTISKMFLQKGYTAAIKSIDIEYRNIWSGERRMYQSNVEARYDNFNHEVDSFSLEVGETICSMEISSGWLLDNAKVYTSFGRSFGPFGNAGGDVYFVSMSQPTLPFEMPSDSNLAYDMKHSASSNPCLALHGLAYQEIYTSNDLYFFNIHFIFSGVCQKQPSSPSDVCLLNL